jgi:perosamine synthetase
MTHFEASRWPIVSARAIAEINELLTAGEISLQVEQIEMLEAELCGRFEVRHALVTCNGTSAGFSAFHAIGLKPGDEVVVPSYTHWATALPALRLNCRITFADSEPEGLGMSVRSVEGVVSPSTRAVVACHLYGNPVDIRNLRAFCETRHIYLIEDISHGPGASVDGQPIGSFGDVAFCSMQAAKVLAAGEGGFLLTNDSSLYARAVELGHPKRLRRLLTTPSPYLDIGMGFKFRPSALHVALARNALRELESANSMRTDMFQIFRTALGDIRGVEFPQTHATAKRVYWEYELFLTHPRAQVGTIVQTLKERGYIAGPANFEMLPDLPHFTDEVSRRCEYPNSRRQHKQLLVLRAFTRSAPETARSLGGELRGIIRELD